jgi:acyl-CoA reductase-like NAD-dependent aldehyde dehydrogenase
MVDQAVNAGAKVLYQSAVPPGPGLFLPITILTDVTPAMRVVKEEVFGPVLTITPFDDEGDALRAANDSEYGLGGSIWSGDAQRAAKLAARLDSGGAWVNQDILLHGWDSFLDPQRDHESERARPGLTA